MKTTKQKISEWGMVVFFSFMSLVLIFGTVMSFCVVFSIGCTPPAPVKPLFGIAFLFASFVTYKVVTGIYKMVTDLVKGKDYQVP